MTRILFCAVACVAFLCGFFWMLVYLCRNWTAMMYADEHCIGHVAAFMMLLTPLGFAGIWGTRLVIAWRERRPPDFARELKETSLVPKDIPENRDDSPFSRPIRRSAISYDGIVASVLHTITTEHNGTGTVGFIPPTENDTCKSRLRN